MWNILEWIAYRVNWLKPDPRRIQLNLTGFLGAKDTPGFCTKLWKLLLSAQANPSGVPDELIEAKKQELRQEKVWQLEFFHCKCIKKS